MVTIRNNSLELEDGDTISVDGTELTFRSSGELEFPDGETAISLSDIDSADIAPNSVDADSVSASNELTIPRYSADSGAPDDVLYYHTGQNQFRYKDSGGTVRGVDPSQLSLADLGSRSHSDLSDAPSSAHHVQTQSSDITITDTQPGTVADGEVLINSAGNLTGGSAGIWEETPGSPFIEPSPDQTSSYVTGIDSTYDFYKAFVKIVPDGTISVDDVNLQINGFGETHYEEYFDGSSATVSETMIGNINDNGGLFIILDFISYLGNLVMIDYLEQKNVRRNQQPGLTELYFSLAEPNNFEMRLYGYNV